jgi:ribonuclease G
MPSSKRIGISRKIRNDDERQKIKAILRELKLPQDMGFVARTAAEGSTKRDLQKDVDYLRYTYERIRRLAREKTAPSLLFEELNLSARAIRDFLTEDTAKVIIDEKQEFKRIRQFTARIAPQLKNKISLYKEHVPLFEKYGVEKEIDKLFERKIFLKCGGYITIEQTEGMVAIDVNSGRFTSKKNLEETVFKVNCEAAEEVARQLRLRDVGGIVVIDFIDMETREHRNQVFSILQNALKKDRAKTQIVSLSELDIVEMTRQRIRRSLESASYQNCPYCEGKGMVKSAATMSIVALRQLRKFLRGHRARNVPVELSVHPYVAQRLVKEDAPALDILRKTFKRRISVVADDKLHTEEVKIAPPARH